MERAGWDTILTDWPSGQREGAECLAGKQLLAVGDLLQALHHEQQDAALKRLAVDLLLGAPGEKVAHDLVDVLDQFRGQVFATHLLPRHVQQLRGLGHAFVAHPLEHGLVLAPHAGAGPRRSK